MHFKVNEFRKLQSNPNFMKYCAKYYDLNTINIDQNSFDNVGQIIFSNQYKFLSFSEVGVWLLEREIIGFSPLSWKTSCGWGKRGGGKRRSKAIALTETQVFRARPYSTLKKMTHWNRKAKQF